MLIVLLNVIYVSLGLKERSQLRAIFLTVMVLFSTSLLVIAGNGFRLGYVVDSGMRGQSFNWNVPGMASSRQDLDQALEVKDFIIQAKSTGHIVEFPAEDSLAPVRP